MLLVLYDFKDDKVRGKFSRFLKKFGRKIQYSVYEIRNSDRVLQNILKEVELEYKKMFKKTDSIIIIQVCESCKKKIVYYGSAENEEKDVIIFK